MRQGVGRARSTTTRELTDIHETRQDRGEVMNALIVYWTKTGHTGRAAEDIAGGLREGGVDAVPIDIRKGEVPQLEPYGLLIVGSPCHAGSVPGAGPGIALRVYRFLRSLESSSLNGKRAAAFSVNCSLGGARTVASMERLLARAGADVLSPGPVVRAGVPFSLWEGPRASDEGRARLREFGRRLARTGVVEAEETSV